MKIKKGQRIKIPVSLIEFIVGGNTIWIQNPQGGTAMRIKCHGEIKTDNCNDSPTSHSDILVDGNIDFCLSKDVEE